MIVVMCECVGCHWTAYSAWDTPAANTCPAPSVRSVEVERPCPGDAPAQVCEDERPRWSPGGLVSLDG